MKSYKKLIIRNGNKNVNFQDLTIEPKIGQDARAMTFYLDSLSFITWFSLSITDSLRN